MARELKLLVADIENPLTGQMSQFSYGDIMMQVLRLGGSSGKGLTLDEIEQVMDAIGPIKKALESESDSVTLTETQYKTLKERLDQFQFAFASTEIMEFGRMIRNAPEIGTDATPIKRSA